MFHRPVVNSVDHIRVTAREIAEPQQRDYRLGDTMNIDGERLVMEVSNRSVLSNEVVFVKLESTAQMMIEFRRVKITLNITQRAQIVTGVKAVYHRCLGPSAQNQELLAALRVIA